MRQTAARLVDAMELPPAQTYLAESFRTDHALWVSRTPNETVEDRAARYNAYYGLSLTFLQILGFGLIGLGAALHDNTPLVITGVVLTLLTMVLFCHCCSNLHTQTNTPAMHHRLFAYLARRQDRSTLDNLRGSLLAAPNYGTANNA